MRYHTLIIGAGMSGLAAGIRLAYYDHPVCIVERHTTIGGLNSFYRLRGRNYDVGLHAVTNFAPPGTRTGPLAKLLKQLRLRWADFDLAPQCGSRVEFPQATLRFSNDFALLRDEVARAFPGQIDGFDRLVAVIREVDIGSPDASRAMARATLAGYISDPLLIDMLLCPLMFYGSALPRDMDFQQFCIMFRSIFLEGLGRPFAGVRQILKTLVRHYRALGGELKLRHGVREIAVRDGRACGVVLDDGREIEAEHVLSSVGIVETYQLAGVPVERRPAAGELSFNEAVFTLDRQPSEIGHHDTIVFYSDRHPFVYDCPEAPVDVGSGIICSPNNFDYAGGRNLPEGVVRVTALSRPAYWMRLAESDYQAEKQAWCDRMAASAAQHMPDFRPHVVETDVFTPRTIRRFTGHIAGAVYGAPDKQLTGTTPIERLYLCGTDQGFLGITGSMLSGISMANAHLLRESSPLQAAESDSPS